MREWTTLFLRFEHGFQAQMGKAAKHNIQKTRLRENNANIQGLFNALSLCFHKIKIQYDPRKYYATSWGAYFTFSLQNEPRKWVHSQY